MRWWTPWCLFINKLSFRSYRADRRSINQSIDQSKSSLLQLDAIHIGTVDVVVSGKSIVCPKSETKLDGQKEIRNETEWAERNQTQQQLFYVLLLSKFCITLTRVQFNSFEFNLIQSNSIQSNSFEFYPLQSNSIQKVNSIFSCYFCSSSYFNTPIQEFNPKIS